MRQTWSREAGRDPAATAINDFAGANYAMLSHAYRRAADADYPVRGSYAVCRLWEDGQQYEARLWVGGEYFEAETFLGELLWVQDSQPVPLGAVPPVAWSEGMRLGNHLWSGRVIKEDEQ